jgi:hypothetical protein
MKNRIKNMVFIEITGITKHNKEYFRQSDKFG